MPFFGEEAWGPPVLAAAASTFGSLFTNQSNRREAERNRQFQERMSSSAAQRSVKDFKLAGLNPALAYGTTASSPSGSMSQAENVVERGVSSAMRASELKIALRQSQADAEVKQASAAKMKAEGATAIEQGNLAQAQWQAIRQSMGFRATEQPFEQRLKASQALLSELLQPGAKAESRFSGKMGEAKPMINFLMSNAQMASRLGKF